MSQEQEEPQEGRDPTGEEPGKELEVEEEDCGSNEEEQEEAGELPHRSLDHLKAKLDELPQTRQNVLLSYPCWNHHDLMKWYKKEDGLVVVEYPKSLTKVETWIQKKIGGPLIIKRPLDKLGTDIWLLCDGKHTLLDICHIIGAKYKEEVEPVFRTVPGFISQLVVLGLMLPKTEEELHREKAVVVEEVEL